MAAFPQRLFERGGSTLLDASMRQAFWLSEINDTRKFYSIPTELPPGPSGESGQPTES